MPIRAGSARCIIKFIFTDIVDLLSYSVEQVEEIERNNHYSVLNTQVSSSVGVLHSERFLRQDS